MTHLNALAYTREQLLALPLRPWTKTTRYTNILVFPSLDDGEDDGSINIIGCQQSNKPTEIITKWSDYIEWHLSCQLYAEPVPVSQAMNYWSDNPLGLKVGPADSRIKIYA